MDQIINYMKQNKFEYENILENDIFKKNIFLTHHLKNTYNKYKEMIFFNAYFLKQQKKEFYNLKNQISASDSF